MLFAYSGLARHFGARTAHLVNAEPMNAEKTQSVANPQLQAYAHVARPRIGPPSPDRRAVDRTRSLVQSLRSSRALAATLAPQDEGQRHALMAGAMEAHLALLVADVFGEAFAVQVRDALTTPLTEAEKAHALGMLKLAPKPGTAPTL